MQKPCNNQRTIVKSGRVFFFASLFLCTYSTMVETIKYLPALSPTRFHQRSLKEIALPIFLAVDQHVPTPRKSHSKRWIGRCPGDPPRSLKISDESYASHRQSPRDEFDRHQSLTIGRSPAVRAKQRQQQHREKNRRRDRWKSINVGAPVSSMSILSDVDAHQQSRLSHASSKSFTTRKELLRSVHQSANNGEDSSTFWQKNGSIEYELGFNRSPPLFDRTHIILSEDLSEFEAFTRLSGSSSPTRSFLPTISPFKDENQLFPPDSTSSIALHSSCEHLPAMNRHKASGNHDLLLAVDGENPSNAVARKMYKLPLPSHQERSKDSSSTKKISRSKSVDKKPNLDPLESDKRDLGRGVSPMPTAVASIPKRQTLMSVTSPEHFQQPLRRKPPPLFTSSIPRRSASKGESKKWSEPYVGARFDPPTPPSSPSLLLWFQHDTQTRSEQSSMSGTFV